MEREEVVRRNVEGSAELPQERDPGKHAAGLVAADRPHLSADLLGELLLGERCSFSRSGDALSDEGTKLRRLLCFLQSRTSSGGEMLSIVVPAIHDAED
jgi:hypothetical protein